MSTSEHAFNRCVKRRDVGCGVVVVRDSTTASKAKRGPRYIGVVNLWSTLENVVMPKVLQLLAQQPQLSQRSLREREKRLKRLG